MYTFDVIIVGAGASGLMCAIEAAKRKRRVIILEHGEKPGSKIKISGGGRCNFTNYNVGPDKYISHNKHFVKSVLARFKPHDILKLINKYKIPFYEKEQGQLFCKNNSVNFLDMLLEECNFSNVEISLNTKIDNVAKKHDFFIIQTDRGEFKCSSLVIATGGLSIPKIGASALGYKIAKQFGIKVWPTRPGLVPLIFNNNDKKKLVSLTGISVACHVAASNQNFYGNLLFTHRGLSGPVILQISSYWKAGEAIIIDLLPNINLFYEFKIAQKEHPNKLMKNFLTQYLPQKVVSIFLPYDLANKTLRNIHANSEFNRISDIFKKWLFCPNGTEDYSIAEVTLGGVDCDAISSKTMETKDIAGLYFIGEVLDVSGWLGGYNLHWAWGSGWAAGQVV
jgi:predicted Rossmann fold flavoprotein